MRLTETPVSNSMALALLAGMPRDLQLQTVANDSFSESANAFMLPAAVTISEKTSLIEPESTQTDAGTQQNVLGADQTCAMTPWERIDGWLTKHRRPWAWLGAQLQYTDQQIGNWKGRGVPPKEYENISLVLGESMDWIVGRAAARGGRPRIVDADGHQDRAGVRHHPGRQGSARRICQDRHDHHKAPRALSCARRRPACSIAHAIAGSYPVKTPRKLPRIP